MAAYLVETFVTLVAVCALAVAVLWGARRLGIGRPSGPIELCGHLPLDARRAIYLIRVGEQVFIVGVGEGGFTKLGEMPADAMSADAGADAGAGAGAGADVRAGAGAGTPESGSVPALGRKFAEICGGGRRERGRGGRGGERGRGGRGGRHRRAALAADRARRRAGARVAGAVRVHDGDGVREDLHGAPDRAERDRRAERPVEHRDHGARRRC